MQKPIRLALIAGAIFFSASLLAQGSPVTITSVALVESTDASGKVKQEPAATVPPGGKVLLKTTITNNGKQPAKDVVVTNPVPEHTVFDSLVMIDKIGAAATVTYSLDGVTFAAPGALTTKAKPKGAQTGKPDDLVRPAVPSDYRFVRWTLTTPLQSGGLAEVGFSATVE